MKRLFQTAPKSVTYAFCCIGALIFIVPVSAFFQRGDVSVESRIDKSQVTVGDLVLYEVIVKHSPDIEITMPPPGINLGGFEIRGYEPFDPVKKDDLIEQKVKYTIAAYDTGTYVIPPTGVLYMTADSVQNSLLTDAVTIRVESILSGDEEDILDIKAPLELLRSWRTVILLSLLGLSLAFLGVFGYIYYRKKKRGESLFEWKKEPERPAHEEAFEALNWLRESTLLADGRIKDYYIELSEIVRLYLQKRYFKPILEMTTTETKAAMAVENIAENVLTKVSLLLDECDMVKFAKYLPDENEHENSLQQAYDIINLTKIEAYAVVKEEQEVENDSEIQPEPVNVTAGENSSIINDNKERNNR